MILNDKVVYKFFIEKLKLKTVQLMFSLEDVSYFVATANNLESICYRSISRHTFVCLRALTWVFLIT